MVPAVFFGCENENQKSLSMPNFLAVEEGKIIFNAVEDAEYYVISINDIEFTVDAKFSNSVQIIDNKINYDANKIFEVGESYTVKVKAISSTKNDSSFTRVVSYHHATKIDKPRNVQINDTLLTWDLVENTSYYKIKVVTPYDNVLLDKEGNVLVGDDADNIAKADIAEYSFTVNQFNFSSLLSKAGDYKFYINAVHSGVGTYSESGFSTKTTYKHVLELQAPQHSVISKVGNELHLVTVVDENANAIYLECGEYSCTLDLNGSNGAVQAENNLLDINLNQAFEGIAINGKFLDLSNLGDYSIKLQSKYKTANDNMRYYVDSPIVEDVEFSNVEKIKTPIITINEVIGTGKYLANISVQDEEKTFINGFDVLIATPLGVISHKLERNVYNLMLDNFDSLVVVANGFGHYLNSSPAIFTNSAITTNQSTLNIRNDNFNLIWNDVTNAVFVVEYEGKVLIQNENSFSINKDWIKEKVSQFKVTSVVPGKKPKTESVNITYNPKLATPTFGSGQGFTGSNMYTLTFTGSENAVGYYVYIKSAMSADYIRVDKLFTSTTINLAQYISNNDEYSNYQVKVQAVANKNGVYSNSELSVAMAVSHVLVLDVPRYYQVNGFDAPITKQEIGEDIHYILNFYGVVGASKYEILINYNKRDEFVDIKDYEGLYQVDITEYLREAGNYEIKIRAIPDGLNQNIVASEFSKVYQYVLTEQLDMVTNIQIQSNDERYILSFDLVNHASNYRVRIAKVNDSAYPQHLLDLGLSNPFEVSGFADITDYVRGGGEYHVYVTALASIGGFFADANESNTYGQLLKLDTLPRPANVTFENKSRNEYLVKWNFQGDDVNYIDCVDYYLVKVRNPLGQEYETKTYNSTVNINNFISVQGDYTVKVYSMVENNSENSAFYLSSSATEVVHKFSMTTVEDCVRAKITYNGKTFNHVVESVEQLASLLWYYYEFGVDYGLNNDANLKLHIYQQKAEDRGEDEDETLKEAIVRLASEANDENIKLYDFKSDNNWNTLVNGDTTSIELLNYISSKILTLYSGLNVLETNHTGNVVINENSGIFTLNYKNKLNARKVFVDDVLKSTALDYGNDYKYLDSSARRGENVLFEVDKLGKTMPVQTTEQILIALQNGMKPEFVGLDTTAKNVYDNAKKVLRLIVNEKMTDVEKATAIFDWISYAFTYNYYAEKLEDTSLGYSKITDATIDVYGTYAQYYLEGIFGDIKFDENGEITDLGSRVATAESYSKAFVLLCRIEGVEAEMAYGTYSYKNGENTIIKPHVWNKVNIATTTDGEKAWFNVDLMFSDNRIDFVGNLKYGISSHNYFLVSDDYMGEKQSSLNNLEIKENECQILSVRTCNVTYDYYSNATFKMTKTEIFAISRNFGDCSGFTYAKHYNSNTSEVSYQGYASTSYFGQLQNFILNSLIYTTKLANQNESKRASFEFSFKSTAILSTEDMISDVLNKANAYSLNIKLGIFTGTNAFGNPIYDDKEFILNHSDTGKTTLIFFVNATQKH